MVKLCCWYKSRRNSKPIFVPVSWTSWIVEKRHVTNEFFIRNDRSLSISISFHDYIVSWVLCVHPIIGSFTSHTPFVPPPCRLQPLLLFCSVWFGVILLFLWRGCIQLYIYYTTLVFTAVLHIHHCGDELTKSQQLPLHDWLHIAVYIVKEQFTIYMLRSICVQRTTREEDITMNSSFTLWWWPHVATRGTESR